jgi:hypothetical protein
MQPVAIEGKSFCFLPILKEKLGLPVHLNGSFQVKILTRRIILLIFGIY